MNEYNTEKVLAIWKIDFIKDFVYSDIAKDLERANILSTNELETIKCLKNEKEKIEKLFFYLVYRNVNFQQFLNILRAKYEWLAVNLERDWIRFNEDGQPPDDYYENIRRLRREIPKHTDLNVHRCSYLWDIKQKLLSLERHEYLVVHGKLSFGKRWIVMDACCNYSAMHQMQGRIFWLSCSKCRTAELILQKLEQLAILATPQDLTTLTNYKDINNKTVMLTETLRNCFAKSALRDCLIVLVDVQNYDTIRAFDLNCKILITTRNKKLMDHLADSTHQVEVTSGFTREESLELFSKVLDKPLGEIPQNEALDLHRICKTNPFIISLIANNLKEYKSNDMIRWNHWKKILENYESTNYEAFRKPIEQSLKALDQDYRTLYESLVIFTDNVNIPLKVLELYWNRNRTNVEEIVRKLDKLYLLQTQIVNGEMYCSLHYHYYSYLTNHISAIKKPKMHKLLVDNYRIPDALKNRTEVDIADLPNDGYFHFYIGYHLKESAMRSLFPKLFLDFGFLEQKLRITGLPNTLGDLNQYKDEITSGDARNIEFIEQLSTFFSNIEEIITKSPDSCLLQYALGSDGLIKEEALKQAKHFPNRVFFHDLDHSVKHRQIVQLPKLPIITRFIEPNSSLIVFNDNSIFLTDMSLQYTVEPTVYMGHHEKIRNVQYFADSYFISIDVGGVVKIWSLKETAVERRRESRNNDDFRPGARQHVPMNAHNGRLLQSIETPGSQTTCFLLLDQENLLRMMLGTKNGKVFTYQWNADTEKFDIRHSESFETRLDQIQCLFYIPSYYLMVVNAKGATAFVSLKDHSAVARTSSLEFPKHEPINIHRLTPHFVNQPATLNNLHIIAVVYFDRIFHITISPFQDGRLLSTEEKIIYKPINEQNFITCSAVTDDYKYLILGTRKGIIVLHPETGREVLRSSVSDNITCIDVCSTDHDTYKYILISATKNGGSVLNVQAIEIEDNCIRWATNRMGSPLNENCMNGKESFNAWLIGGQVFDVYQPSENEDDEDNFILVAADSNMFVHRKSSENNFSQTIRMELKSSQVTAISVDKNASYIGCENGSVYQFGTEKPYFSLDEAVRFLKFYGEFNIIIAGTMKHYKIRINDEIIERTSKAIKKSFIFNKRFIILVKDDCSFDIFDSKQRILTNIEAQRPNLILKGCDILDKTLLICTKSSVLQEFRIDSILDSISIHHIKEIEINRDSQPVSLAISLYDKILFAIGYDNGTIELYDKSEDKIQLLKQLRSHRKSVHALKFSPNLNSSAIPIILVSISEEMCFWNVTHILNNPIEEGKLRLSQRFQRKTSSSTQPKITPSPLASPVAKTAPASPITNGHSTTSISSPTSSTSSTSSSSSNQSPTSSNMPHRTNHVTNGHNYDITPNNHNNKINILNNHISISLNNGNCDSTNNETDHINPWIGKTGASDKPELLSCIKFVGTSAEKIFANKKFTKFITIDDEGEIYYLNILNLSHTHI